MGLIKFINNLRYLSRYNIKDLAKFKSELEEKAKEEVSVEEIIEQVLYEIPGDHVKRPKIKNFEETVNDIIENNASIVRFGDGEYNVIMGENIVFQDYDTALAESLKNILISNNEKCFIGINYHYYYCDLINFTSCCKKFYRLWVSRKRNSFSKLLDWEKQYYSTSFTAAYQTFVEYDFEKYFDNTRKIWNNRDIVIVCGETVFKEINYNIYDNAKSINYIYAPSKNAYDEYDRLYKEAMQYPKDTIIICILGPTAKVLAYNLSLEGYQALDLGHLAKDYDHYKKGIPREEKNIFKFFMPD